MKRLLVLALLLFPVAASAQQGTIKFERAVQYEFEVPERLPENMRAVVEADNVTPMLLYFSPSAWVLQPVEVEKPAPVTDRAVGITTRLKMGSTARSDRETFLATYVNSEDGTVTETREFMGRTFRLSSDQPSYAWKLTGEESEFLGYRVQKATAEHDGAAIEAWFTPEIPVPAGPAQFGGLPGMILAISANDGKTRYSAQEVSLDPVEDGVISAPTKGDEVSNEEYEKIVDEKLKELEATRARRIRR